MRIHCIALLIAGALATPAFAQDAPADHARASIDVGLPRRGLLGWDHTEILDDDEGGVLYGVGVGYDFQAGRAVLSIEAEANDSTNNGCVTGFFNAGDRFCVTSGRDLYVGARAGFLVGRNVLLFGKAGYTNARYITEYDDPSAGIQRALRQQSRRHQGRRSAPSSGSAATPISGPRRAIPIMRAAATAARSWAPSASASERRGRAASGGARPPFCGKSATENLV